MARNGKDPKRIIKSLSATYMKQSIVGCGQEECSNPFCKRHNGSIANRIPLSLLSIKLHREEPKQLPLDILALTKASVNSGVFCVCPSLLKSSSVE